LGCKINKDLTLNQNSLITFAGIKKLSKII